MPGLKPARSIAEIAKKHNVSPEYASEQLAIGMAHEKEHSKSKTIQSTIARQHLDEDINYYKKLKSVGLEDGGMLDKPVKLNTYEQRVKVNLEFMGTPASEWRAVPIKSFETIAGDNGRDISIPIFDFPTGYDNAIGLFPISDNAVTYNCELCGKVPIKIIYWLQNDKKKQTLRVGSECVKHFGDGMSGKQNERAAKIILAKILDTDCLNALSFLRSKFKKKEYRGYGKYDVVWSTWYTGTEVNDDFVRAFYELPKEVQDKFYYRRNKSAPITDRNKIYWETVYKNVPVFNYEMELKSSSIEEADKKILSWFTRFGKDAEQMINALVSLFPNDLHSDYLDSKITKTIVMQPDDNAETPLVQLPDTSSSPEHLKEVLHAQGYTMEKIENTGKPVRATIDNRKYFEAGGKIGNIDFSQLDAGGALVGIDASGNLIAHGNGSYGGYALGRSHKKGGIKLLNTATGEMLEMQGAEVVINAAAANDPTLVEYNGEKMTKLEVLSEINTSAGNGVAFAARGMKVGDSSCGCQHTKHFTHYKNGGELNTGKLTKTDFYNKYALGYVKDANQYFVTVSQDDLRVAGAPANGMRFSYQGNQKDAKEHIYKDYLLYKGDETVDRRYDLADGSTAYLAGNAREMDQADFIQHIYKPWFKQVLEHSSKEAVLKYLVYTIGLKRFSDRDTYNRLKNISQ